MLNPNGSNAPNANIHISSEAELNPNAEGMDQSLDPGSPGKVDSDDPGPLYTYLRTVQTITPERKRQEQTAESKERAKLISTTSYNLKAKQELQAQLKKEKEKARKEASDNEDSQVSREVEQKPAKATTVAGMMKKKEMSSALLISSPT